MPWYENVIRLYEQRAATILVVMFALTVGAVLLAKNLTLESDLERLLPDSSPSVRGLERLEEAYGSPGRLKVVVDGSKAETNRKAVDAIAEYLRDAEGVERVEAKRPLDFFNTYRLLYIDLEDLETIAEKVRARIKWEKQRANPMFVSLGDDDPPEVDISDIEKEYRGRYGTEPYFRNEEGTRFVLFVDLTFPTSNVDAAADFLERVRPKLQGEIPDKYGVEVEYTGRYKKRVEQRTFMQRDLSTATLLAFGAILVFLLLYFRNIVYPLVVFLPLVCGTAWSFAWAEIVFGSLNILTGFLGAVLLGLGIDYGIHLVSRYHEARGHTTIGGAVLESLLSAGRASLYAGLTTLIALGSLAVSSFQAFFEFGILSLGGLTLILVAYGTVLPCLLFLMGRSRFEPTPPDLDEEDGIPEERTWPSYGAKLRNFAIGLLVVLAAVASLGIGDVAFEYDFNKLTPSDLPSWELDRELDKIFEFTKIPAIVLAEDPKHASRIKGELQERKETVPGGDKIERVVVLADFLPEQQSEKLEIIRDLHERFDKLPDSKIEDDEDLSAFDSELAALADEDPITRRDLPENIRAKFERRDDPDAAIVMIVPTVRFHDARETVEYTRAISELPGPGGEGSVDAISEEHLLQDILDHVSQDTVWMLLLTVLGLLFVSWIAFRDVRRLLLVVATIGMAIFVCTGFIGLAGWRFNFINMMIWPIWLGLGVDATFHLMVRVEGSPRDWSGFWHTVGAVFAAFGTSMIGFGAMMISKHPGLSSLGRVAVLGLGAIFVVSVALHLIIAQRSASSARDTDDDEGARQGDDEEDTASEGIDGSVD